jgi:hypothetical protein
VYSCTLEDRLVIDIGFENCIAFRWGLHCSLIFNMLSMPLIVAEVICSKSRAWLNATLYYRNRTFTYPPMSWGTRLQHVGCSALLLLLLPKPLYSVLPSQYDTEQIQSARIVNFILLIWEFMQRSVRTIYRLKSFSFSSWNLLRSFMTPVLASFVSFSATPRACSSCTRLSLVFPI